MIKWKDGYNESRRFETMTATADVLIVVRADGQRRDCWEVIERSAPLAEEPGRATPRGNLIVKVTTWTWNDRDAAIRFGEQRARIHLGLEKSGP